MRGTPTCCSILIRVLRSFGRRVFQFHPASYLNFLSVAGLRGGASVGCRGSFLTLLIKELAGTSVPLEEGGRRRAHGPNALGQTRLDVTFASGVDRCEQRLWVEEIPGLGMTSPSLVYST